MSTIEETIATLEKAHGASTQGEWRACPSVAECIGGVVFGEGPYTIDFYDGDGGWIQAPLTDNDKKFIVAAHNALSALLEYIRALEEVAYQAKMTGDTSETLREALADLDALREKTP